MLSIRSTPTGGRAIARLRIERLDQRAQRRPRHNPLQLGKKRSPPRRLGVALKPHCRQRQLFHPPTRYSNPPRHQYTTSLQPTYAEVPYSWTHPASDLDNIFYLNTNHFLLRYAVYIVLWNLLAALGAVGAARRGRAESRP